MSEIAVAAEVGNEFPHFTEEHDMIRQTVKRFCKRGDRALRRRVGSRRHLPARAVQEGRGPGAFRHPYRSGMGRPGPGLVGQRGLHGVHGLCRFRQHQHGADGAIGNHTACTRGARARASKRKNFCGLESPAHRSPRLASASPAVAPMWRRSRLSLAAMAGTWSSPGRSSGSPTALAPTSLSWPSVPLSDGYKGVSLVLFPTKTKGFSVGKKLSKIGNMASDTAELFFDECRIPAAQRSGRAEQRFLLHHA